MTRFTPFPKRDTRFGAPMGRVSTRQDFTGLSKAQLCVSQPQGEYDSGGAYWGLSNGEGSVRAVWERGNGAAGVMYVRAWSLRQALRIAMGEQD